MKVAELDNKQYLTDLFSWVKGRDVLYKDYARMTPEEQKGKVLIRHDVDDLFMRSFDMAVLQHSMGVKATYFILNTAPYWKPHILPHLMLVLREMQLMGHEISWHCDAISQWVMSDGNKAMNDIINEPLATLRSRGLKIVGSASHGNKLCYKYGYINYEVFEGCERPEGSTFLKGTLDYPKVDMKDFGLEYEAYHLPRDQYFSESGGEWAKLPVKEGFDDKSLTSMILIHPQHWVI